MNDPDPASSGPVQTLSDRLNQNCFCTTLDRRSLCEALEHESGDPEFCETFIRPKAHLFSNVPVFLSASEVAEMQEVVAAIETTARLAAYKAAVLSSAGRVPGGGVGG
jgi:hypothetical protein